MDIIIINPVHSFQKHCEADVFEKTKVFQCTASLCTPSCSLFRNASDYDVLPSAAFSMTLLIV